MSSPPLRPQYQLGGLVGFIPLSEDNSITTRGQRLPSLIQSRSSTMLFAQSKGGFFNKRRSSFDTESEDVEAGPSDETTRAPYEEIDARRMTLRPEILMTPQMRSMRLIGQSNPRYHWHQYYKTEEELKAMKKPLRKYYERNNFLIAQYMYIDRLLDSSLPHDLIQEYNQPRKPSVAPLDTISEEQSSPGSQRDTLLSPGFHRGEFMTPGFSKDTFFSPAGTRDAFLSPSVNRDALLTPDTIGDDHLLHDPQSENRQEFKRTRTPRALYKLPDEGSPLLKGDEEEVDCKYPEVKFDDMDNTVDSSSPIVTLAIYLNLAANIVLLIGKIVVIVLTSSLSVLASLVDAVLDFLSTAIVWTTTKLISRQDQYAYPVGRRRLEPVGVLVFSVIMMTSFFQVALECFGRLISTDHEIVELTLPAIIIMLSTVFIKGFLWFWCRLVNNSSIQALAQDAATDVVFNTFSIIFPLIGFYAKIWWLDALGGLLLSLYVMFNWSATSSEHVRNLCGAAASADQRNVLLYLTMRFAKTIKSIQGLQAYHAGDKLNVEVDIVLDENTSLRDSHDLGESLQYVLESVPIVDRAFVHADYWSGNLPSHMNQQGD